MARKPALPVKYVFECLQYDPETGVIMWRERPPHHFDSTPARRSWNNQNAGEVAGSAITEHGRTYRRIIITKGGRRKSIPAHKLAWVLQTGEWPHKLVEHKNSDRLDNRFDNLQLREREIDKIESRRKAERKRRREAK